MLNRSNMRPVWPTQLCQWIAKDPLTDFLSGSIPCLRYTRAAGKAINKKLLAGIQAKSLERMCRVFDCYCREKSRISYARLMASAALRTRSFL